MNKTTFELFFEDSIQGIDLKTSQIVPTDKSIKIRCFGGCLPYTQDGSYIALQWGSAGNWQTVRVGSGTFEFNINKTFIGDGIKQFRLIRNSNGQTSRQVFAWLDAIIL